MIQYAIYQSKANNYTKGKFYARAIHTDIVDLEGIAEHMCRHNCSYSKGQIIGLLDDMVGCIREICLDGNAVKLPDFAIFKPGIRTKEPRPQRTSPPQRTSCEPTSRLSPRERCT